MLRGYLYWMDQAFTAEQQAEEQEDKAPITAMLSKVEAEIAKEKTVTTHLALLYSIHGRLLSRIGSLSAASQAYEQALQILDRYTGPSARHLAVDCLDALAFIKTVQGQMHSDHPELYEEASDFLDRADVIITLFAKSDLKWAAVDWQDVRVTRAQLAHRVRNVAVAYGELAQAWMTIPYLPEDWHQLKIARIRDEIQQTDRVARMFARPGRDDMPDGVQTVLEMALGEFDNFDWKGSSNEDVKQLFERWDRKLKYVGPGSETWVWPTRRKTGPAE